MVEEIKIMMDRESLDNETCFISGILADVTQVKDITLMASMFKNEKLKSIFNALLTLNNENGYINELDLSALMNELKGKVTINELLKLIDNGTLYRNSVKTLESKIKDTFKKNKCFNISQEISKKIIEGAESEEIYLFISNQLENEEIQGECKAVPICEALISTLDGIEKAYKQGGKLIGMPTGYKVLDKYINGVERKKYIIIGARPGVGKTAFSLELAKRLGVNNKILYFSLEMSKEELTQRITSNAALINGYKIKNGSLNEEEFKKVAAAMNELSKLKININDNESLSVEELNRQATREKMRNGLDVVIVDYLTLLNTEEKYKDERVKFNIVSNKLREMAKRLNVAVICLAQLNRAVESRSDKKPQKSDLRETGNIEQDANIILLLNNAAEPGEYGAEELEVIIAKNRGGEVPTKPIIFNYYKKTQRIEEKYI